MTQISLPRRLRCTRFDVGFSLIELMIVISIVSIMVAIAIPNLKEFISHSRAASATSALQADIAYARNEAARRRASLSICPYSSYDGTNYTCGASGANWSAGWLLYVTSGLVSATHTVANANVLRVRNGAEFGNISVSVPSTATINTSAVLTLNSLGGANQTGTFTACATGVRGFTLAVNASGSITKANTASVCP